MPTWKQTRTHTHCKNIIRREYNADAIDCSAYKNPLFRLILLTLIKYSCLCKNAFCYNGARFFRLIRWKNNMLEYSYISICCILKLCILNNWMRIKWDTCVILIDSRENIREHILNSIYCNDVINLTAIAGAAHKLHFVTHVENYLVSGIHLVITLIVMVPQDSRNIIPKDYFS